MELALEHACGRLDVITRSVAADSGLPLERLQGAQATITFEPLSPAWSSDAWDGRVDG